MCQPWLPLVEATVLMTVTLFEDRLSEGPSQVTLPLQNLSQESYCVLRQFQSLTLITSLSASTDLLF